MPLTRRTRTTKYPAGSGKYYVTRDSTGVKVVQDYFESYGTWTGSQVTDSEGHPFQSRKRGDLADLGGEFRMERTWAQGIDDAPKVHMRHPYQPGDLGLSAGETAHYEGPLFPHWPEALGIPESWARDSNALNQLGATAVSRCKPTNSPADAATFLGELVKDRIPDLIGHTLWRDKTRAARDAGDEFLNVQFGWLPLVRDVKSFSKAASRADKVLDQYERDSGKVVRRTYRFPVQREHDIIQKNPYSGGLPLRPDAYFWRDNHFPGMYVVSRERTRRVWFSGAFTYHLPSAYDSRKELKSLGARAELVYGAKLTPKTLWELAPWSWAVDWFSNAGDVISNISDWATWGLVMHYGYVMEHSIVKYTYSNSARPFFPEQNSMLSSYPIHLYHEVKQRKRANPFGFGVSWEGLSPIQYAIAAALGLSRS